MFKVLINLAVQTPAVGAIDIGEDRYRVLDLFGREQDCLVISDRGHQLAT